jgi:hypothetical protein
MTLEATMARRDTSYITPFSSLFRNTLRAMMNHAGSVASQPWSHQKP